MIDSMAINKYLQKIHAANFYEEKVLIATRGFIELFPFSIVQLYNYMALSKSVEGLYQISDEGISSLVQFRNNLNNLPILHRAIQQRKAIYAHGAEFIQQTPDIFLKDHDITYIFIVPICSGSTVIGYVTTLHYYGTDPIGENLLQSLTYYGKLMGFALDTYTPSKLSKRETEVLQMLSQGHSVKEIAQIIEISEFTINDYVKSAILKLEAKNRVHAVAEALRQQMIK